MKNDWIPWNKRKPAARQLCDFLYRGDIVAHDVWILAGETSAYIISRANDFDGEPAYWRIAEPLPKDVKRYGK